MFFVACSGDADVVPQQPQYLDVVEGLEPVQRATTRQHAILDRLHGLDAEEQNAVLEREWPDLAANLVSSLRRRGSILADEEVVDVQLLYGSAMADGEDAAGVIHSGRFENQLLASIEIKDRADPLILAVRCTNGLYDIVFGAFHYVGNREATLGFTIQKGEGLMTHVSYETAIDLAEMFDLRITRGRGIMKHEVTPDEARQTDDEDHFVQVLVFEGDHFDVGNSTYAPAL